MFRYSLRRLSDGIDAEDARLFIIWTTDESYDRRRQAFIRLQARARIEGVDLEPDWGGGLTFEVIESEHAAVTRGIDRKEMVIDNLGAEWLRRDVGFAEAELVAHRIGNGAGLQVAEGLVEDGRFYQRVIADAVTESPDPGFKGDGPLVSQLLPDKTGRVNYENLSETQLREFQEYYLLDYLVGNQEVTLNHFIMGADDSLIHVDFDWAFPSRFSMSDPVYGQTMELYSSGLTGAGARARVGGGANFKPNAYTYFFQNEGPRSGILRRRTANEVIRDQVSVSQVQSALARLEAIDLDDYREQVRYALSSSARKGRAGLSADLPQAWRDDIQDLADNRWDGVTLYRGSATLDESVRGQYWTDDPIAARLYARQAAQRAGLEGDGVVVSAVYRGDPGIRLGASEAFGDMYGQEDLFGARLISSGDDPVLTYLNFDEETGKLVSVSYDAVWVRSWDDLDDIRDVSAVIDHTGITGAGVSVDVTLELQDAIDEIADMYVNRLRDIRALTYELYDQSGFRATVDGDLGLSLRGAASEDQLLRMRYILEGPESADFPIWGKRARTCFQNVA